MFEVVCGQKDLVIKSTVIFYELALNKNSLHAKSMAIIAFSTSNWVFVNAKGIVS